MNASAISSPWSDPLDVVAEPRAWLALFWPMLQTFLGALHLVLLSWAYGFSLSLVPFAVGLPLLSLSARAAWWVAELEARLAAAMVRRPLDPVEDLPPARGFLLGLGSLVGLPAVWTRHLGLLLTLPMGILGMALVTTLAGLAFAFLMGGLVGAFGWVEVQVDGWVFPPTTGTRQALWILGGLVGLLGVLHLAWGWVRLHARVWRALR